MQEMSSDITDKRELRKRILISDLKHMPISFAVMAALTLVVFFFNVPNPNIILITGLAVFTSLYGWFSGIVCALIMIAYSMYFFSTDHSFIFYTAVNMQKMGSILLGVGLTTFFVGLLKYRKSAAVEEMRHINALLASDNESLKAASFTDVLTGVRTRFALRHDYDGFMGRDVDIMMLDVDDFKSINDRFGHPVGDEVLRTFGDMLSEAFGVEHCYRFGGDEFVVIADRTDETSFKTAAAQLSNKLKTIRLGRNSVPVHFSAGCVYGHVELPYDLRLMLRQSDALLYKAKKAGKDLIEAEAYSRERASMLDNSVHYTDERSHNAI